MDGKHPEEFPYDSMIMLWKVTCKYISRIIDKLFADPF